MKVQFLITVTFAPNPEPQAKSDFEMNDGKAMIPYLKEKLLESIAPGDTWQYNAVVTKATVKKVTAPK
jgi:hypothetical protein